MTYLIAYHDKMTCIICNKILYKVSYEKHKLSKRHIENKRLYDYKKQKKYILSFS
jgi:hypothetical protein